MNGKLYLDVNGTTNASSQESAYKLAGAATSEAMAVNKHSDSSNQDDDSNLEEDSGKDESGPGERMDGQPDGSNQPAPNIQEQIGSNSECTDSSDKQSVKRNAQGVLFMNEDSIDLGVNATTIKSRENNNKTGGNNPSSVVRDSNKQNAGSESSCKLSPGSVNAEASDTTLILVDSADNFNNNSLHNAVGVQLSACKRRLGDPEGSDLPLKRYKVLADPQNNEVLEGIVHTMDDDMKIDSCDSMSDNGPVAAGIQGVTSQSNCTNSESKSEGSINGGGDSSSEESQHVHEIQSDSEDDHIQRVSKPGKAKSDDLDTAEDSFTKEDESTDGSDGEIQNDEHVSINSDTEPEAIDDDSSKDSNSREAGELVLVDDTYNHGDDRVNQRNKMKLDEDIHEVSDSDDIPDGIPAKARAVIDIYPRMSHKLMDVTRKLMVHDQEMAGIKDKSQNAVIFNDTKDLVGLFKSKAFDRKAGEMKGPTKVIFDTNSSMPGKSARTMQEPTKGTNPVLPIDTSTTSSYQSITARGTKSSTITVSTSTNGTPILSSLTDDMFVVEAPSFIVPYVYEKPSVKPLREFVDIMGKELDDKRLKEEKEKIEKEKLKPEVKKDKTDEVPTPKPLGTEAVVQESLKEKKSDKKAKKRDDDGDVSWNGTLSSESDDDLISEDNVPKTITIKEKEEDFDGIIDLISEIKNTKSDNYFDNFLGKFFINIGVNLVQEYVQVDLLKQQKRKLHKENRSGSRNIMGTELAIKSLTKNLEVSQDNNAPYKFQQKKCEFCSFKSESTLVMAHHMETPHMKNNIYKCNFCAFEIRSPHDILYHVEAEHKMRGRLERAPAYHQCSNCSFEDNGKSKLARHLLACAKKFKPAYNLGPPVEWDPPAKLMIRAHHNTMNMYQAVPTPAVKLAAMYRGRGQPAAPLPTVLNSFNFGVPLIRGGLVYQPNQANLLPTNYQLLPGGGKTSIKANPLGTVQGGTKTLQHRPTISITPVPRAPMHTPSLLAHPPKPTFVICEICDGYIKDLDQLRNHMQWIHKVKIHPKMIHGRPPLNCQKCQFRFFTDQGLERHLLGSHGLVTSSMQELANCGKDAGRCPTCGRVYQWKLLNHVAREHNITLKPAHLSYKCTVCAATFGMYKQFESHVYSAHSVAAKSASSASLI